MATRQLRDAGTLLLPAVRSSVDALKLGPEHEGLVALALALAADVDAADAGHRPRLYAQMMKALDMLARHGEPSQDAAKTPPPNWLDAQRDARARRDARRLGGR